MWRERRVRPVGDDRPLVIPPVSAFGPCGHSSGRGKAGRRAPGDQLSKSALPHRLEARVTPADGRTKTLELALAQGAGAQRRAFRAGEVGAVRFTLDSACQPSATKQVAIAEIEFSGPSKANRRTVARATTGPDAAALAGALTGLTALHAARRGWCSLRRRPGSSAPAA